MIAIPLLPNGNFLSVARMVEKIGGKAYLVKKPEDLRNADRIILAGVGAFDQGMSCLIEDGWKQILDEAVFERKVPIMGICLGMQLMCNSSEEGQMPGLGWIDAVVKRISVPSESNLKIPHMGWNTTKVIKPNELILYSNEAQRFYFVHSFHVKCNDSGDILALTNYGTDLVAAFSRNNIFGVQFHPEKSHKFGMMLMKKFLELRC